MLIQRAIAAIPGGTQEKTTTTGTARRIAIGPTTPKLLREQLTRCQVRASACGAVLDPSAFVFSPNPTGQMPWHP